MGGRPARSPPPEQAHTSLPDPKVHTSAPALRNVL